MTSTRPQGRCKNCGYPIESRPGSLGWYHKRNERQSCDIQPDVTGNIWVWPTATPEAAR